MSIRFFLEAFRPFDETLEPVIRRMYEFNRGDQKIVNGNIVNSVQKGIVDEDIVKQHALPYAAFKAVLAKDYDMLKQAAIEGLEVSEGKREPDTYDKNGKLIKGKKIDPKNDKDSTVVKQPSAPAGPFESDKGAMAEDILKDGGLSDLNEKDEEGESRKSHRR